MLTVCLPNEERSAARAFTNCARSALPYSPRQQQRFVRKLAHSHRLAKIAAGEIFHHFSESSPRDSLRLVPTLAGPVQRAAADLQLAKFTVRSMDTQR